MPFLVDLLDAKIMRLGMTMLWPPAAKLSHTSPFIDQLEVTVAPLRQRTLESPFPLQLRDGTLKTAHYARLLVEIYHYVKHSTRLLALAASRLGPDQRRLFQRFLEHAKEESGHEQWALGDLRALGANQDDVIASAPLPSTVALYAYQYYVIEHVNPIGLLGYIYALETLGSGSGAAMGNRVKTVLGVGDEAVTFLLGHGDSNVVHVEKLRALIDKHARAAVEQTVIRDSAVATYAYYRQMLDDVWEDCGRPSAVV